MTISPAGLQLIKDSEALRLTAYQDGGGVWTIGYGTTAAANVGITPKAGMTITPTQAEQYLLAVVNPLSIQIQALCKVPMNDNQLAACTSLAYNIGLAGFKRSTVLRKYLAGDLDGAARAFSMWNKDNGKVVRGLTNRRAREANLFST